MIFPNSTRWLKGKKAECAALNLFLLINKYVCLINHHMFAFSCAALFLIKTQ